MQASLSSKLYEHYFDECWQLFDDVKVPFYSLKGL